MTPETIVMVVRRKFRYDGQILRKRQVVSVSPNVARHLIEYKKAEIVGLKRFQ